MFRLTSLCLQTRLISFYRWSGITVDALAVVSRQRVRRSKPISFDCSHPPHPITSRVSTICPVTTQRSTGLNTLIYVVVSFRQKYYGTDVGIGSIAARFTKLEGVITPGCTLELNRNVGFIPSFRVHGSRRLTPVPSVEETRDLLLVTCALRNKVHPTSCIYHYLSMTVSISHISTPSRRPSFSSYSQPPLKKGPVPLSQPPSQSQPPRYLHPYHCPILEAPNLKEERKRDGRREETRSV